jgi:drug/metabolite transporter (DMT)-like permease
MAYRCVRPDCLLPMVATILRIVLLDEHGSVIQILGGALVMAGVYWVESGRSH